MQKTDNRLMEARELRVGNWIDTPIGYAKATMIGEHGVGYKNEDGKGSHKYFPYIQGIPITPEILEAAGFEKYGGANWMWCIDLPEGRSLTVGKYDDYYKTNVNGATVRNLHQLQNLYFALTGSELPMTFKNKI